MPDNFADRYGNTLTTSSDRAVAQYDIGMDHVLAATYGAVDAFRAAIAEDPTFALAHVGLARALTYAGDMAGARAALADSAALKTGLSDRELSHITAFELLFAGRAADVRAHVKSHVHTWPRAAICAHICTSVFGAIGFSGLPGREASLLAFTEALMPHYQNDWWMMGMHATSLCESGMTTDSRDLMEQSLALNPANANAAHFKGHGAYEDGDTDAGLAYLEEWIKGYDPRGVMHGHLQWHVAIWALELGQIDRMWALIDDGVGPGTGSSLPINVITDTAAILHRAALAGVDVPAERWQDISRYTTECFPNAGQSFVDLHAGLAHAMAGDSTELEKLTRNVAGFAGDLVGSATQAWTAIVREDWQGALELLTPVMGDHARFGGSRAQRDLLELTWLHILLKLGRSDEAKRTSRLRRPAIADRLPLAGLH